MACTQVVFFYYGSQSSACIQHPYHPSPTCTRMISYTNIFHAATLSRTANATCSCCLVISNIASTSQLMSRVLVTVIDRSVVVILLTAHSHSLPNHPRELALRYRRSQNPFVSQKYRSRDPPAFVLPAWIYTRLLRDLTHCASVMTEHSAFENQSYCSPHGELRTAFYNPHEIKRRRRTSRSQFKTLEKAFCENPKPNASTRRHLAQSLSMTPRGIQVWFQNRRAKSKQTSNAPRDHVGADETKNRDEASRMDESPLNQAQDDNPFRDIWQKSKENASCQQLESMGTAASSLPSLAVTAPSPAPLRSTRRQTISVPGALSSFPDGEHTNAHHILHLTWDPSKNWQNIPNVVSISQSSSSIKSSSGHRKESVPQPTLGTQDKSVERRRILQFDGSPDSSDSPQPTSVRAPSDGQGTITAKGIKFSRLEDSHLEEYSLRK